MASCRQLRPQAAQGSATCPPCRPPPPHCLASQCYPAEFLMEIPSPAPAQAGSGSPGLGQQQTPSTQRKPSWPYKHIEHTRMCTRRCKYAQAESEILTLTYSIKLSTTHIYHTVQGMSQVSVFLTAHNSSGVPHFTDKETEAQQLQ